MHYCGITITIEHRTADTDFNSHYRLQSNATSGSQAHFGLTRVDSDPLDPALDPGTVELDR